MDAKLICNLGLGKLGTQSRVANLDPPVSGVEKHCAQGYPTWRDSELRKHRWVFQPHIQATDASQRQRADNGRAALRILVAKRLHIRRAV
jgi:hypothetical protein